MPIKIGTNDPSKINWGGTEVTKVYSGSTEIWTPSAGGDPFWSNVHALAKFEDADLSTSLTDEANGTWQMNACNVTHDYSKFGLGSMFQSGAGCALVLSNPPDVGSGDFTIEWWGICRGAHQTFGRLFQTVNGDLVTGISLVASNTSQLAPVALYAASNGSGSYNLVYGANVLTPVADQWYHWCFMKAAGVMYCFVDGVVAHSWPDAGNLFSGATWIWAGQSSPSRNANWMPDEIRITEGVARYSTAGFTPPTDEFPVGP